MNDSSEHQFIATLPAGPLPGPALRPVMVSIGPDCITSAPQLLQKAGRAILREEIEVWINEGGAGDEPRP